MKKHQVALLVLLATAAAITVGCAGSSTSAPSNPTFSKLGFWSSREGSSPLYTMNLDGSSVTNVAVATDDVWGISTSADNSVLEYTSDNEVWTSNIDGSNAVQLTDNTDNDTYTYSARISPDGKKIVYAVWDNSSNISNLWIMNVDGSNSTNLTATLPSGMTSCFNGSFSADSTKVAIACFGDSIFGLYTVNIDGTQLATVMTQSAGIDTPMFTPDSKGILFVTYGAPGADLKHAAYSKLPAAYSRRPHRYGTPGIPPVQGVASVNVDGSNPIMIVTNTNNQEIFESVILNSNLYYAAWNSDLSFYQIYKANLDGTGSATVSDGTADDELGVCGDC